MQSCCPENPCCFINFFLLAPCSPAWSEIPHVCLPYLRPCSKSSIGTGTLHMEELCRPFHNSAPVCSVKLPQINVSPHLQLNYGHIVKH